MAQSTGDARQIPCERFVESCGAVLFDLSDPQDLKVCLIQARDYHEWHLAKGRRNCGESRQTAALREVMEETGLRCRLFPVTMATRATPPEADEHADLPDKARVYEGLTEPFMCMIREIKHPKRTKIVWWYIASLEKPDGDSDIEKLPGEEEWLSQFFPCKTALNTLTYQGDRDVVAKAVELVTATLTGILDATQEDDEGVAAVGVVSAERKLPQELADATSKLTKSQRMEATKAAKKQRKKEKKTIARARRADEASKGDAVLAPSECNEL